jgi:hypothetical protein
MLRYNYANKRKGRSVLLCQMAICQYNYILFHVFEIINVRYLCEVCLSVHLFWLWGWQEWVSAKQNVGSFLYHTAQMITEWRKCTLSKSFFDYSETGDTHWCHCPHTHHVIVTWTTCTACLFGVDSTSTVLYQCSNQYSKVNKCGPCFHFINIKSLWTSLIFSCDSFKQLPADSILSIIMMSVEASSDQCDYHLFSC